jgi:peptidoglycan-associated lipoprotein
LRTSAYVICAGLVVLLGVGCSKKVTKVDPVTPRDIQEPVLPQSPRDDSFVAEDPDARLRELLRPVHFDYDRHTLSPEAIGILQQVAPYLAEKSNIRLLVEGHCDERGSSDYNMGLGDNRARAVIQWLVSYGIPRSRFESTSYGKERPASSYCQDESCHGRNRRAEWVVVSK